MQSHDVSTLGEVTRASAPDLEAVVTAFLHQEIKVSGAAFEAMRTHIERVTIRADHLELRLLETRGATDATAPGTISIPWRAKPTRLEKGIVHNPVRDFDQDNRARAALLKATAQSRGWLKELIDGAKLQDIARKDGRSERQIRVLLNLAFLSPSQIRNLLEGAGPVDTITSVARQVPVIWPELALSRQRPAQ